MAAGCPPCHTPALRDRAVGWDQGMPAPCKAFTTGGLNQGGVCWGQPQGTLGDLVLWVHAQGR